MQEFIEDVIRERLEDVNIKKLTDGAVIFETAVTYDRLNFFCFNNIFAVIDILEQKNRGQKTGSGLLNYHLNKILANGINETEIISQNSKQTKSFRIVCSVENTPVPVDEKLKEMAENYISRLSSLKINRSRPDTEFWFLCRSEGFSCFLKRLTNNRAGEKTLHPGELGPQLAWMLCKLAGLKHGEIAADPFCGYGAIPFAACKQFPVKKFYASDRDAGCVKITASKNIPGSGPAGNNRCEIFKTDISHLSGFIREKIDAFITDPPWGMFSEESSLQDLYDETLSVFSGLLNSGGRAVILTAAVRELETAVENSGLFSISRKIPILVSGKKAAVFLLELNSSSC